MDNTTIPISRSVGPSPTLNDAPQQSKFPTEWIDLPSQGFFYDEKSPLSSGRIELKYMTAREEDILTSQNLIKKGVVLEELMKSLIVNPNINFDEILIGDKNAILIASRRLAYGDKYPVKITCPECGENSQIDVNLASLKFIDVDFDKNRRGVNQFDYQLPYSKRNITFKLLNHADETSIDAELKALAKVTKNGVVPEMTTRLKYMITSVDGNSDKIFIKKFVDNELASKDSIEFRRHLRGVTPSVDMNFDFTCPACGHTARMAVPLGVDFFWPTE
jgi:predicted RNA-binding Zn-ribbon protein involved in translation (DUF1610 family)